MRRTVDRLLGEVAELNFSAVEATLDSGVDVNARGTAGVAPFFMPLYRCGTQPAETIRMLRLLADRGADVEGTDEMGNTHLLRAVQSCDAPVIIAMIDLGANANPPPNRVAYGTTPLTMAIILDKPDVAEALVDRGARLHKGAILNPTNPRMKKVIQRASGTASKEIAPTPRPATGSPEGKKLYTTYCFACHGDSDRKLTATVPSLIGSQVVEQGAIAVQDVIRNGRGRMPSSRYIPEADQGQIARYVVATFGRP